MRELSLFSGAGGGLLGTKLLGWTHCGYVEYNDYCQRVIKQRILDGILENAPIFGDIQTFIDEGYAASYQGMVDVVTAGFPCQPFSVAGKQCGEDDERNMWPQTLAVLRAVRPRFAFLENVPGLLVHKYVRRIFGDLAENGFNARWCVLGFSHLGGPIQRKRLWIVAESNQNRRVCGGVVQNQHRKKGTGGIKTVWGENRFGFKIFQKNGKIPIKWLSEPETNGMADGVANHVERLAAIGNGQVPTVVAAAWRLLTE